MSRPIVEYKNLSFLEDLTYVGTPASGLIGVGGDLVHDNFLYLADIIPTLSPSGHTHDEGAGHDHDDSYATIDHLHTGVYAASGDLSTHITNVSNPHSVTAEQVGAAASNHTHEEYATSGHDHTGVYAASGDLTNHIGDTNNPHVVTIEQIGAAADDHMHVGYATAEHDHDDSYSPLNHLHMGIYAASGDLSTHIENTSNPHNVTLEQIGAIASGHDHAQYLLADGTSPLTNNWDAGEYTITSNGFYGPNVTSGVDPGHTHSIYASGSHTHDLYSLSDHDHDGTYATPLDLSGHTENVSNPHSVTATQVGTYGSGQIYTFLEDKASASDLTGHTTNTNNPHSVTLEQIDAAASGHTHADLYSPSGHAHNDLYSLIGHLHEDIYSPLAHDHDLVYSPITHDHDLDYSDITHDHDSIYASGIHTHAISDVTGLQTELDKNFETIGISVNNNGSVVSSGLLTGLRRVLNAGTLTTWAIDSDVTGSLSINIKRGTAGGARSTIGTASLSSSDTANGDTTGFTGYDSGDGGVPILTDDVFQFEIPNAPTGVTAFTLSLKITR